MSLVEGHAEVVMDGVGPEVIPSVEAIRAKFTVRRRAQGLDGVLRRLLGLDAKMRQYQDGSAFCRSVIDAVGMDGFNRVWTSPETLPTRDEITDPRAWLARVHRQPIAAD
jgi:putative hydrolase